MAETTIRLQRKGGYTVLQNTMLRDRRLSLKTKGLFAVLLSLPGDWQYSVSGLASYCGVGRDAVRGSLRELEGAGYLAREQTHGPGGKFGGNTYLLRDESSVPLPENPTTVQPLPEKPLTEKPSPENQAQQNNIRTNNPPIVPPEGDGAPKPRRRRTRANPGAPEWKPERFARFWRCYPRGEAKQRAVQAWDRLKPDDALIDRMARALQRQLRRPDWREGVGIPYASTWLNQARWEDEERAAPDGAAVPGAIRTRAPRPFHFETVDGEEVVVYDD